MNFPVVGMASSLTQMWERKQPHLQSLLSISCSSFQSPAVSSSSLLQSHPVYYGLFQSTVVSSSLLRHLPVSCSFFQWSLPVYSSLLQSPAQSSSHLQFLPVVYCSLIQSAMVSSSLQQSLPVSCTVFQFPVVLPVSYTPSQQSLLKSVHADISVGRTT